MHCPNCGTKTSAEHKYCRACGLSLDKVAELLSELAPLPQKESLEARKQRLERWGLIALSPFVAGVLGLILYGIVYKVMIVQGRTFEGLGLLAFLLILASGLLSVVLFAQANEAPNAKALKARKQKSILNQSTNELLTEGEPQSLPSVTERTTDLLLTEKPPQTKKL